MVQHKLLDILVGHPALVVEQFEKGTFQLIDLMQRKESATEISEMAIGEVGQCCGGSCVVGAIIVRVVMRPRRGN